MIKSQGLIRGKIFSAMRKCKTKHYGPMAHKIQGLKIYLEFTLKLNIRYSVIMKDFFLLFYYYEGQIFVLISTSFQILYEQNLN
jgi:hypothetical protein